MYLHSGTTGHQPENKEERMNNRYRYRGGHKIPLAVKDSSEMYADCPGPQNLLKKAG